MKNFLVSCFSSLLLFTGTVFMPSDAARTTQSLSLRAQQTLPSPGELIDAVNNLRIAYGLPPLSVNSILMYVAQSQADYLRTTEGGSGHGRANGMSLTEQLLSLGYPLGGDLSLGGYRSENYIFGDGMDVQTAIHAWLGDDPHTNTMLSPNYFDIGGGVAIGKDGTIYYVIDTARHTANGRPQDDYTPVPAGTVVSGITINGTPGINQFMVPITLSTPNSGGLVIHEVRYGQTLWSIAIAYNTTIQQIRNLNDLPSTDIYSDQKLLIRRESTPTSTASPVAQPDAIISPTLMSTSYPHPTQTSDPDPLFPGSDPKKDNLALIVGSLSAALCLAGFGFWANRRRT